MSAELTGKSFEDQKRLIKAAYDNFNLRDIDATLTLMHNEVIWPNGMEGGVVYGHDGVREYWTRQWSMINPHVEPEAFSLGKDGSVVVDVHQVVRDLNDNMIMDRMVQHIYYFENGLIKTMIIQED
jgi:hypothetical protein